MRSFLVKKLKMGQKDGEGKMEGCKDHLRQRTSYVWEDNKTCNKDPDKNPVGFMLQRCRQRGRPETKIGDQPGNSRSHAWLRWSDLSLFFLIYSKTYLHVKAAKQPSSNLRAVLTMWVYGDDSSTSYSGEAMWQELVKHELPPPPQWRNKTWLQRKSVFFNLLLFLSCLADAYLLLSR